MRTLSNNRGNAIGPWYVNANNGPSNSNGNNWGGRTSKQMRKILSQSWRILLNQPLIKSDFGLAGVKARFASQSPLIKRGLVGWRHPLEETRCGKDARRRVAS